jgi:tetratricopeptide (TPR) repeat protein
LQVPVESRATFNCQRAPRRQDKLNAAPAYCSCSSLAHGYIGLAKYFIGRSEETEAHVQNALRLSPRDTNAYLWTFFAGAAKFALGDDDEAIARFRGAIETNRNYPLAHFYLAATLALRGSLDEARTVAQSGLALDPTFTIRRFRVGVSSDNPTYLALRDRLYEGMRQAGVPEA